MHYTNLSVFYDIYIWFYGLIRLLKSTVFQISLCAFYLSILPLVLMYIAEYKTMLFTDALKSKKYMTFVFSCTPIILVISLAKLLKIQKIT